MVILDIILLLCFIPAIVNGLSKGFVSQVVQIVAIILGAWAAFHFSSMICDWLAQYLTMDRTLLNIIAFILVVAVITILLNVIGNLLTHLLKALSINFLNRLLGLVFSILKVALVLGLLITLFENLNASLELVKPEVLAESRIYMVLSSFADFVFPYLQQLVAEITA